MRLGIELGVVLEEADYAGDDGEVVEPGARWALGVDLEHPELDGQLERFLKFVAREHPVGLQDLIPKVRHPDRSANVDIGPW